jgi:hypothetical protein
MLWRLARWCWQARKDKPALGRSLPPEAQRLQSGETFSPLAVADKFPPNLGFF